MFACWVASSYLDLGVCFGYRVLSLDFLYTVVDAHG